MGNWCTDPRLDQIVAGCIGAHFARGKVKSVGMRSHGCLNYQQVPLPLPFKHYQSRLVISLKYSIDNHD